MNLFRHIRIFFEIGIINTVNIYNIDGLRVYFHQEIDNTSSGARFWNELIKKFSKKHKVYKDYPEVSVFNISASPIAILLMKLRRTCIILRIDGCYADPPEMIISRNKFLKKILFMLISIICKVFSLSERKYLNLFDRNFIFGLKVLFSNAIIYQSNFSENLCKEIGIIKKNKTIILNAFPIQKIIKNKLKHRNICRLVTTFAPGNRYNKQLGELLKFVVYLSKQNNNIKYTLKIIGFNKNNLPPDVSLQTINYLEKKGLLNLTPDFSFVELAENLSSGFNEVDIYISFSLFDPCPNTIIEAQAFGIPVVGVKSGGLKEIVNNELLLNLNFKEFPVSWSNLSTQNYPKINFSKMKNLVDKTYLNLNRYRRSTIDNFKISLDIDVAYEKYKKFICNINNI